jgi:hypothetical protein
MEANIKNYRFKLISELVIAVYDNDEKNDDVLGEEGLPFTFIRLEGSGIRNAKDFHYEIMDWYNKYVQC